MHKQRLAVVVAAGIGIISVFLPWISISFFGISKTANGLESWDGYLALALFAAAGAMAFIGEDRNGPIDADKVKLVTGFGGAVTAFLIIELFRIGMSYAGSGLYIGIIVGLVVLAVPFVIKDSGEFEMPTKGSIKDEFNEMKDN